MYSAGFFPHAGGTFFTHVIQHVSSSALLLLCLLQCVKGNYYLNVGLVNLSFCQKLTRYNNLLLKKNGLLTRFTGIKTGYWALCASHSPFYCP